MKKKSHQSQLASPGYEEYLQEIGRVTANFGVLELYLLFLFNHLLGTDLHRSSIVFYSMDNRPRIDLIKSIAENRWKKDSQKYLQFKEMMHKVSDANSGRNAISHCLWASNEPKEAMRYTFISRSGTYSMKQHKESVGSLSSKANKVMYANQALWEFFETQGILPALPEILQKPSGPIQ